MTTDGERRDCLDCHGTLVYDGDDEVWEHEGTGRRACP